MSLTSAQPAAPRRPIAALVDEIAQQARGTPNASVELDLLSDLVAGFDSNPSLARRAMRELSSQAPIAFVISGLQLLKNGSASAGQDYLISLLCENDMPTLALTSPEALSTEAAIELARRMARIDPHLDSKLIRQLFRDDAQSVEGVDPGACHRILEILDAIGDPTRMAPALVKLARHPEKKVQSKAALLLGRAHLNQKWFASQVAHPDPRIRANALEGLLKTTPSAEQLQCAWTSLRDPHHRVVTTALLVLHKAGDPEAAPRLKSLAQHPSELFRTAAAWAMGQSGDAGFLPTVQQLARTDAGSVRRMALRASVALRKLTDSGN